MIQFENIYYDKACTVTLVLNIITLVSFFFIVFSYYCALLTDDLDSSVSRNSNEKTENHVIRYRR